MGTYYFAVCDEKKEKIDPFYIDNGAIKSGIIYTKFANLLTFKLLFGEWPQARIVGDYSEEYNNLDEQYLDVTLRSINEFNEFANIDFKINYNPQNE